jgi:hypothetical protein
MNLDSLNLAEQQLLLRLGQVTGLMEEKHEQLQQKGVFREYVEIYEAYVDLIESESEGLEALKRATFLMWYEQAEPACFSGVFGLSEAVNRRVLVGLERGIEADGLDFELKWMLPYYNMIAEWVFPNDTDLPHLRSFLANADFGLWERVSLKVEEFTDRGQMGEYWLSIINQRQRASGKAQANKPSEADKSRSF